MTSPALAAFAESLATRLATDLGAAATPMTSTMQLLIPSTSWNWPTDANGTSSAALYDFCSWVPASNSSGLPFAPSPTRFSDGYKLFLRCLQSDELTTAARVAFQDDTFYTTVLFAGSGQPRMPAWNISQFPQTWLADVAGGSSTAGTIHVKLPAQGEPQGGTGGPTCFALVSPEGADTPIPLGAGQGQSVDIHADAWGQISVRPSGWYDGALLTLKSGGPFLTGNANTFFGADGILRNILTGLCVALNPTITASVTADFAARLHQAQRPGSTLRVAGLHFDTFETSADTTRAEATTRLTASSAPIQPHAVIVGVTIASLTNHAT